MKRLSEEEYNPDQTPQNDEGEGGSNVTTTEDETVRVHTSTEEEATQQAEAGRLLPDGMTSIEGEIPDNMMPGEQSGDEPSGEQPEGESPDEETTGEAERETEGEDTPEGEEDEQEMDDVNASQGWVEQFTKKTGIDAEDEDEAVEKVRTMHRDLRGFSQFSDVLEQVPQAAQLMHNLAQGEGEIDPVDFYLAAQDVEGLTVQAPDKAENPNEWADFKAKLNERQKNMKNRREQQKEQRRKQKEIRQDFEQAFNSFKKRKGLDDDEAEQFKQEFAKTFYGDAEAGELPRMDVFDLAWEALRDQNEEDAPPEKTDTYKQGYNQAIEDMKSGGADGLPDLKDAAGTGSDDGGAQPTRSGVPDLLQPSGDDTGMNHDAF